MRKLACELVFLQLLRQLGKDKAIGHPRIIGVVINEHLFDIHRAPEIQRRIASYVGKILLRWLSLATPFQPQLRSNMLVRLEVLSDLAIDRPSITLQLLI